MKKIYTLLVALTVSFSTIAQNKVIPLNGTRANGDTLMWFPLPGIYLKNTSDQTTFAIVKENIDGLTPYTTGAPADFGLSYSTDTSSSSDNNYHPWENPVLKGGTDSAFFYKATSWFNPIGQANNWLMMGPITLPAGGILKWYDKTNPGYRDGYRVLISSVVSTPMTSTDFTTQVFIRADATPGNTQALDTTWALRTVTIPAQFNAQSIYLAFNHTANDQDVLKLDEFTIVEAPLGIEENAFVNGIKLSQNSPNPFTNSSVINFELEKASPVILSVFDVTGKKVNEQNEGNLAQGKHAVKVLAGNLSAGVYYYSLAVEKNTTSAMKMVVIK